jgi:hypothetical protein
MTVTDNRFISPAYIVHFFGSASGNTLTDSPGDCMFEIDGSGRFEVSGNTFPTGVRESCIVAAGTALHGSGNRGVVVALAVAGVVAVTGIGVAVVRRRRRTHAPPSDIAG